MKEVINVNIKENITRGLESGKIKTVGSTVKFANGYEIGMLSADTREQLIEKIEKFCYRGDAEHFLKYVESI